MESIVEYANYVIANWASISATILSVIGAAATIAALTPTPRDDSVVAMVRKVLDIVGMNILNAKNKE